MMPTFEQAKAIARGTLRLLGRPFQGMRKYEIAKMLGRRYDYRTYLEICTPTTGLTYSRIDKKQFINRKRFMYQCPQDFLDGEPIDFRSASAPGEELLSEILKCKRSIDLVFVDGHHTYDCSNRDIHLALQLVSDNGIVLIHDCNPPTAAHAVPESVSGGWTGVTFAAYVDVVKCSTAMSYITVDTDFGCGIISKDLRFADYFGERSDATAAVQWRNLELSQKYEFLAENRSRLLNLVSPKEFRRWVKS